MKLLGARRRQGARLRSAGPPAKAGALEAMRAQGLFPLFRGIVTTYMNDSCGISCRETGCVAKNQWKKGGKQLELVSIRKITIRGEDRAMSNKDFCELEKGGTLIVRRSIETPMGAKEVKLYFTKAP